MATIQEKIRENKIVSCKFKSCLGRDENGKQIFKCYTWYPPVGLTKAKCRKEAERAAAVWEAEIKQAYALQKEQEAEAGSAKVYTFGRFVNEVWLPLCVRDGSHRPATIAMYTNILKLILLRFEAVPLHEINPLTHENVKLVSVNFTNEDVDGNKYTFQGKVTVTDNYSDQYKGRFTVVLTYSEVTGFIVETLDIETPTRSK